MTGAIMVAGTVLSLFFPNQIFSIFQKDAQLIALGSQALRIISLGFLVSSVSLVYSGLFEALGMGKDSLLITLIRQLILIVPLGFLLSCFLGPAGIWICFPVSEPVAALAAVWIVKRKQILDF